MSDRNERNRIDKCSRPRLLRETLLVAGAALLLAAAAWAVRTPRLPLVAEPTAYAINLGFPLLKPAEALGLYEAGSHFFIDTRPAQTGGHVPGAFVIRQDEFDDDLLAARDFLLPEDPLVLYGGGDLLALAAIASRLQERGFDDLALMDGTLDQWRAAAGPVSGGEGRGTSDD